MLLAGSLFLVMSRVFGGRGLDVVWQMMKRPEPRTANTKRTHLKAINSQPAKRAAELDPTQGHMKYYEALTGRSLGEDMSASDCVGEYLCQRPSGKSRDGNKQISCKEVRGAILACIERRREAQAVRESRRRGVHLLRSGMSALGWCRGLVCSGRGDMEELWCPEVAQVQASWEKGAYTNGKGKGAPFGYGKGSLGKKGGKKGCDKGSTKGTGQGKGKTHRWTVLPLRRVGGAPRTGVPRRTGRQRAKGKVKVGERATIPPTTT